MLFVGARCFPQQGNFYTSLFDESQETKGGCTGRQRKGGSSKASIFSGFIEFQFDCPALDGFLHSFVAFHATHYDKFMDIRKSSTGEAEDALMEFKKDIESDVYALLPLFDRFLQDPRADWSTTLINSEQYKPPTEREVERDIRREQEKCLTVNWEESVGKRPRRTAVSRSRQDRPTRNSDTLTPQVNVNQGLRRSTRNRNRGSELVAIPEEANTNDSDEEEQVVELLGPNPVPERAPQPYYLRPRKK